MPGMGVIIRGMAVYFASNLIFYHTFHETAIKNGLDIFINLGIACKLVCSFIPYYTSMPWTVYPCDVLDAASVD